MLRAVACSFFALGLFLYLLSQATPTLNWQFGTLAAIAILLELLAVPQKRFGLFSTSFSCNFASALIPSVGPSAAALVAVTGITLRTLFKGAIRGQTEDWPTRWREALIDIPSTDLAVVNLVAQHGLKTRQGVPPLRYGALETCLHKLQVMASQRQASLHMPRLGCGLAGGQWERVEALLEKMLGELQVFVYDLNKPHAAPAGTGRI